jgi:FMN phosphatase YigB (HAD superfamily)
VIFDLDETLIHSSDSLREPYDVKCLVKADSYSSLFHVSVRPYARQLL